MTVELLDKIKMTQKWPFKFSDIWSRYFFLIFPVFIIFIGFSEMSSGFKNNLKDLIITSIIICIVGLLLLFFIAFRLYQNQRFDCFVIPNLTVDQIEKVIRRNNFKNSQYFKLGYFVCVTKVSGFSWGEEITIIPYGDRLLINSRPTGSMFSYQPITIFKDKRNIRKIINELKTLPPIIRSSCGRHDPA